MIFKHYFWDKESKWWLGQIIEPMEKKHNEQELNMRKKQMKVDK